MRRVRAHGCASRAPLGEDLGLFRLSLAGNGTAPKSALLAAPWSNGRTRALTGGEVRVRIPEGHPRIVGTSAALTAPAPEPQPGIEPRAMIANLNIAHRAGPFNSKGLRREHSPH